MNMSMIDRWNNQGVKAMLFDDGLDEAPADIRPRIKGQITLTHVTELIERKYKALQEKLMQEMARSSAGVLIFRLMIHLLSFCPVSK